MEDSVRVLESENTPPRSLISAMEDSVRVLESENTPQVHISAPW